MIFECECIFIAIKRHLCYCFLLCLEDVLAKCTYCNTSYFIAINRHLVIYQSRHSVLEKNSACSSRPRVTRLTPACEEWLFVSQPHAHKAICNTLNTLFRLDGFTTNNVILATEWVLCLYILILRKKTEVIFQDLALLWEDILRAINNKQTRIYFL